MTIQEILEKHNVKLIDISRRYGIPYRSLQNWRSGDREAPEYLLNLIDRCLTLESRS